MTIQSLNSELQLKQVVDISDSSLNRLLHNIGFEFKKDNNRRALREKPTIPSMRCQFLRKYMENLQSSYSRDIVFLDETWVFSKGSVGKSWQDDSVKCSKA